MAGQKKVISVLTNQRGKIRSAGGAEIEVKFSFYLYRETGCGVSGRKSAGGCCRVSDSSNVLTRVFEAGLPVMLISAHVEAEIRLSSPYSFQVTGKMVESDSVGGRHDGAGPVGGRRDRSPMGPYRPTAGQTLQWERERRDGRLDFGIRQALSGAETMRRFGPAE